MHNHQLNHLHNDTHGTTSSQRIGWAFFLNLGFTIIEFIGGIMTNSTAIMADAVHDLGDSISIGMAWVLSRLSDKKSDNIFSYGYRRFSLLGALINAVVLVIGSAWVLGTAIPRLKNPEMPVTEGMFALAIFGIAVNGFAAFKLSQGKTMNERVLNWHLLEDVLGWVAVLIVSVILMFAEWPILDPILSIAFTLFILFNVIKNLITTLRLFLQAVPDDKVQQEVLQHLRELESVKDVHHLHFWSLDGEHHVLTAHLVLDQILEISQLNKIKTDVAQLLSKYQLEHTTIEFEFADEECRDTS